MRERMAAASKGDGIVLPQLHGAAGQSSTLGDLLRAIGHPTIDLAPEIAPRRHRVGRREIRIELYCLRKQCKRLVDGLPRSPMQVRHSAQIIVVGVETFGWLALRASDLRSLQLRSDRADDALGDLILQIEDVIERAIETVCPEMRPGRCVDELPRDQPPAGLFSQR